MAGGCVRVVLLALIWPRQRNNAVTNTSRDALKTYSKMAVAQANLFADRNFASGAEQTYRLASQIYPSNVEAATGLSELLMRRGRTAEADQMLDQFIRDHPDRRNTIEDFRKNAAVGVVQPHPGQR